MIAVQAENMNHYLAFVRGFMEANPGITRRNFLYLNSKNLLPDWKIHIVYRLPGWDKNPEADEIDKRLRTGLEIIYIGNEQTDYETLRRITEYCKENLRKGVVRGYITRYRTTDTGDR